jgi:hypothetical protein
MYVYKNIENNKKEGKKTDTFLKVQFCKIPGPTKIKDVHNFGVISATFIYFANFLSMHKH